MVSAAIADGPPRRVLELFASESHQLIVPEPVLDELERVLTQKLNATEEQTQALLGLLRKFDPLTPAGPKEVPGVSGDPDDDLVLAASLEAGAEILVSGDAKHLLPLGEHGGMRIVRPQDFLAEALR